MTPYVLSGFTYGINRNVNLMPVKDETFYDLVNMYVSNGATLKRRNGFTLQQAVSGAMGLTSYGGFLHTFFSGSDPGSGSLLKTHKLVSPGGAALSKVYFAAPLNGYLFVVALYADGSVSYHYLDEGSSDFPYWTANTQKNYGAVVCPNTYNGLRFYCQTNTSHPAWAPDTAVTLNEIVQPVNYNGFYYKATTITGPAGSSPVTSATEPKWPTTVGGTVIEDVSSTITRTKWIAGDNIASGEQMIRPGFANLGLHLQAQYNDDRSRNVNMTGAAEPIWNPTLGAQTTDGSVTWTVVQHTLITWTCVQGNETGATEPTWPTSVGGTVTDGGLTWLAFSNAIWDTNCPNNVSALIGSGRIFAGGPSSEPDIVNYSAVANPRAWSTSATPWSATTYFAAGSEIVDGNGNVQKAQVNGNTGATEPVWASLNNINTNDGAQVWHCVGVSAPDDAGFIACGQQNTSGDTTVTALGIYRGNLVVHTASGFELWQIDENPANITLLEQFEGRGCIYPRASTSIGSDMFYLTPIGIRSMQAVAGTSNLEAGDVGSQIDGLVVPIDSFSEFSVLLANQGQYWLFVGNQVFVLTAHPSIGVTAWSRYTLPWSVLYAAAVDGVLYVLGSDNNLYFYDSTSFQDHSGANPVVFTASVIFPYMSVGRHTVFQPQASAGWNKMFRGAAIAANAPVSIQFGYDESQQSNLTPVATFGPDDRPHGIIPIEVVCVSMSPQISHTSNFGLEISALTLYYDVLTQMVA